MSCAKTAEAIETQFGMLNGVGPGNMRCRCPRGKEHFLGVWLIENIVRHRILGLGKMVSCGKTGAPILTAYMSYYVFLCKELPFGGRDVIVNVSRDF